MLNFDNLLPVSNLASSRSAVNDINWYYVTADLEEAKLDTGKSLSKFKIFSVTRELLA